MASELRVNTLRGVSTAGSISVVAEGNTNTTNLQQGLAKVWYNVNTTGTLVDSLNVSSHDDDGTGDGGIHISSDMANTSYNLICATDDGGSGTHICVCNSTDGTLATGTFDYGVSYASASATRTMADLVRFGEVHGDLA